jgi:hypothetical protein
MTMFEKCIFRENSRLLGKFSRKCFRVNVCNTNIFTKILYFRQTKFHEIRLIFALRENPKIHFRFNSTTRYIDAKLSEAATIVCCFCT